MKKILFALLMLMALASPAVAADSYTPDLRIVQMPTGSNDTQWGIKANAAFAMLEEAIAGGASISVTGGDIFLTTANNAPDEARNAILAFTGTPGTARTVNMPDVSKLTWVLNASDSNVVMKAGVGITSTIAPNGVALIYTDGATNANAVVKTTSVGASLMSATDAAAARTLLGLGTAATHDAGDFMQGANNGSEFTDAAAVRTNIGLASGSTAQTALGLGTVSLLNLGGSGGLTTSGGNLVVNTGTGIQVTGNAVAVTSDVMLKSANLGGLSSTATSRANLGTGSANVPVVTASTSGPSGSGTNVGDLWIQY